ncbi:MAG: hypothetical protein JWN00_5692 [Actinomycetia bacterium]|nr:hypothetical protein [Actinomycetes bacterium]
MNTTETAHQTRPYDLVKEFVIALVAVAALTVVLAAVFSSPDEKPITLASWAKAAPGDFIATSAAELAGTSTSAAYGAPYNHVPGAGQKLGPLPLQRWAGVRSPIDPAQDFVIGPLTAAPQDPALATALATYRAAAPDQRHKQAASYADALSKAPAGDSAKVAPGDYGTTPVLTARLLDLARGGGLDGTLLTEGGFYSSDYTRPLLFLADGTYLADQATAQHLTGNQWGMMNETGNYPGQAWLWLYTFWYQVPPYKTSTNADALIWATMAALTVLLAAIPFIPGLRSIPRWSGIYRLIWRDHYRRQR